MRRLATTVKDFVNTHKHIWLALYFVVYIIVFFTIEAHTPTSGYWVTDSAIDAYIPFVPQFVIFYILWYPLFAAVGIPTLLKDPPAFKRWMYYNMAVLSATLLLDVLIPNGQNLRPENFEVTDFFTWVLSIIWAADTPTNVFPSMHVLGCVGDILCCLDSKIFSKKARWVIIIACFLCMASTVLVKQHAFIDTVGALIFIIPAYLLFYRKRFRKEPAIARD